MTKLYKWLVRDETLIMFDRADSVNFCSALQIQRVGDRAQIHSLLGEGFYKLLITSGLEPFRERGIRYVQAAVVEGHAALLRRSMRRIPGATFQDQGTCRMEGKRMRWVLITDEIGIEEDLAADLAAEQRA
jgi:hypothetical protein